MASVIMSYSFDLVVPGAASSNPDASDSEDEDEEKLHYKAMIPLADMLNADATLNNCRLFETPTGLEMKTILPVPAGAELYNDYGPLPRSDLLRRYGYTTANYTPYDVVEVSSLLIVNTAAGATLAPAEKQARVDYLLDEDILEDSFDLEAAAPADIPDEVLVIVNTVLLTPDDFQRYKAANKLPKAKLTEASAEVLGAVLEARLREYPTTLEEDQRLLVGESLKGRERAAVEVRLGEKQILVAAYKELNRRVQEKKRPAGEDGDEEERGSKRSRN